ncbi:MULTISPECIES: glucose-1-phosphate adenylyltransferase subunit GlgD [unclassified Gemella]|uniref:glucose-1-phosphate adenylyltransferase subunit GlgD n=1 Tax=unclassified Gemella TaxID=2624949 RepID=UPI00107365D0|nr:MULTISPECIES: glucose-1-phosphate adenylyltransferase subunit GlgD [unclassified Gemella]MBF0709883.1 glucose-1-phosphate adenylyltransferase subunit GlgD [Gemella sp. GL1.1]MBF0746813.1 glucose-1-phosphate adenylyltransferase subunit GlgD [Gemella sp. 19428wG2_WT2a]NYS27227.1 glucose-1-phosphate adenylyltransferase subunit GlgD [Gemella sp. GL1]TFU59538.1 glucose-1-phosphate adenylyltransferase subunit GlgD [Gemella sp. WT2a]
MNAFSILLSDNFRGDDLLGLTKKRTLASIPIGSRYRLIDFILSSLVKANISNIGLVVNNNYNSLVDHVGWGKDWDLNRKNAGLKIITPMSDTGLKAVNANKFDALANALFYLDYVLQDYVILADANIVANINFEEMLEYHKRTGADITVAYTYKEPSARDTQIVFNDRGKIYDSYYHINGHNEVVATQLKVHILSKQLLKEVINRGLTLGWEDMMRDYISKNYNKLNVQAYRVHGYCKVINNIQDYYNFNMDLLHDDVREELFLSGTEILTRVKDSVPSFYSETAEVSNSVLADGCTIKGKVENSIISRGVVIEEGVVVRNSIIMNGCVIGKNSDINHTIIDRRASVSEGTRVSGTHKEPYIVHKEVSL